MYDRLFISKGKRERYVSKTFIAKYGATPNMEHLEENTTNIRDTETQVIVGDSGKITRIKNGYRNRYHK